LGLIKAGIETLFYLGDPNPTLSGVHQLFLSSDGLAVTIDRLKEQADAAQKEQATSKASPLANGTAHPLPKHADPRLMDVISTLTVPLESKRMSFGETLQGVYNKLKPFINPALEGVLSESTDHVPKMENGKPVLNAHGKPVKETFSLSQLGKPDPQVFICATSMELMQLGSVTASMIVRSLQQVLIRRFKKPPKDRLFMILDEFSKLRLDHKQVEDFISTSREAGAVSVIFLQDVSQIREEIRSAVLANCQDRYFLHGAGPQTAEWCSKALGDRRRLNTSMSENESSSTKSSSTGLSTSVTESWVAVLRPREIATTGGLRYGAWIVLNRYSHKPMLVDLERPQA
jgi:hypothetical protein